jgi:hypothetical protein
MVQYVGVNARRPYPYQPLSEVLSLLI